MSDQINKFIEIVAVVIIALLLVGAIFTFWLKTQGVIGKANDKVNELTVNLEESSFTQYEGTIVSGTEVVAAIKNSANKEICIIVENGRTSASYIYDSTDLASANPSTLNVGNTQRKTSEYYINPNGQFLGEIIRDEATGGTIVGIKFVVQ